MEENVKPGEEKQVEPVNGYNTPVTPVDNDVDKAQESKNTEAETKENPVNTASIPVDILIKPVISFRPSAEDRAKFEKIIRYQQQTQPGYTVKQMFSDMLQTLNLLGYWKAEDIK